MITSSLLRQLDDARIVRDLLAIGPLGLMFIGASQVVPYLLVIGAFTFSYYVLSNTRTLASRRSFRES